MKTKVLLMLVAFLTISLNCFGQGLQYTSGLGISCSTSFASLMQDELNRNSENESFHIFNSVYIPSRSVSKGDPKAEKVLRDYISTIGGEKSLAKIENIVSKVDVVFVEPGITLNKEIFADKYNKTYIKAFAPQYGEMIRGYDGDVLWEKRQSSVRIIYDEEKTSFLNESAFMRYYNWKKNVSDLEYSGIEKINGTDLHKLTVKTIYGSKEIWYFSKENNLLVRLEEILLRPQGEFTAITTYEDYREVDGILHSYLQSIYMQGQTRKISYLSIKHNQIIDNGIFTKPAEE